MYKVTLNRKEDKNDVDLDFMQLARVQRQNDIEAVVTEKRDLVDDFCQRMLRQQVKISDEEAFADEIISQLPDITPSIGKAETRKVQGRGISPLLIAIRVVSSVAAMLLIGLFVQMQTAETTSVAYLNEDNARLVQMNSTDYSKCKTPHDFVLQLKKHRQSGIRLSEIKRIF